MTAAPTLRYAGNNFWTIAVPARSPAHMWAIDLFNAGDRFEGWDLREPPVDCGGKVTITLVAPDGGQDPPGLDKVREKLGVG